MLLPLRQAEFIICDHARRASFRNRHRRIQQCPANIVAGIEPFHRIARDETDIVLDQRGCQPVNDFSEYQKLFPQYRTVNSFIGYASEDLIRHGTRSADKFRGGGQPRTATAAGTIGEHINAGSAFRKPSQNLQLVAGMSDHQRRVAVCDYFFRFEKIRK